MDPRGDDAYVVCSLHGGPQDSPHDKLCRLLLFMATLREHGAARVTAVVPYLAYARKDRQTQPLDPVTLRYVAQLFEAVGTDQVMVLEAHNVAAFQNAFRCPTVHLQAHRAFDALVPELSGDGPLAVASPDPGGVKRALLWREALEARLARPVHFAMVDKRRSLGLVSSGHLVAGDVEGATVLLLDDLIASGETMLSAATALRHAGAKEVVALAAHGLFVGAAAALDALDAALARHAPLLLARAAGGHVVDGHGDLRPEHVCLQQPPVVIDALEFNAALRAVDPFDELAFLVLECEIAGASWIGPRLLASCAAALRSAPPAALLQLYTAYRAQLRARLALAHLLEPQPRTPLKWAPLAERYLQRSLAALERVSRAIPPNQA